MSEETGGSSIPSLRPDQSDAPPWETRLPALVDDWVARGIITPGQALRMLEGEGHVPVTQPEVQGSRWSLAVEALGYLGGVVVVVSTLLIVSLYWGDLATAWRLILVGVVAGALLAAGFAVPDGLGGATARMRSALWVVSTAAVAGFLLTLGNTALDLDDADVAFLVACGTAVFATTLWFLHRAIAQQITMMVAAMTAAAAVIADLVTSSALPGLGVWAVAVVWSLLGWGGLLLPRRVVVALGAAGAVAGAMTTMSVDEGVVFALVTAAAIMVAASLFRDLVLLAVGVLGAFLAMPAALTRWLPDSQAAPFALLGLGGVLVGTALWIARRPVRRPDPADAPRDYSGDRLRALSAASAVVVTVAAVVLAVALA